MEILIKKITGKALNENQLIDRFPSPRFRVSHKNYAPDTEFSGASESGGVYLLAGACEYRFGNSVTEISAGHYCELPNGSYSFKVIGDSPVKLVNVWDIEKIVTEKSRTHAT